jgi:hypothetical protein
MLKGSDGAIVAGKGGLEMRDDLSRRRPSRGLRRRLGRRTAPQERRADRALAQAKAHPKALPGSVAPPALGIHGTDGLGESADAADAAGDNELQERPHRASRHAQAWDRAGEPNAKRETASPMSMSTAIAAEDPPAADGLATGIGLVEPIGIAVPNQMADLAATRTPRELEPIGDRAPFRLTTTKPSRVAHVWPATPRKSPILPARSSAG